MIKRLLHKAALIGAATILSLHVFVSLGAAKEQAERPIIVAGAMPELFNGYHSWMLRHKEVLDSLRSKPADASINPGSSSTSMASDKQNIRLSSQPQKEIEYSPLLVRTPSIDLYAPSGISVLHSTDPLSNPQSIRSIATHGITQPKTPLAELRPTLTEALQMFSNLKPFETRANEYVLFALTCSETRCDGQRQAIDQLRATPNLKGVRLVEVNLH